jgi:hypothetical protein
MDEDYINKAITTIAKESATLTISKTYIKEDYKI